MKQFKLFLLSAIILTASFALGTRSMSEDMNMYRHNESMDAYVCLTTSVCQILNETKKYLMEGLVLEAEHQRCFEILNNDEQLIEQRGLVREGIVAYRSILEQNRSLIPCDMYDRAMPVLDAYLEELAQGKHVVFNTEQIMRSRGSKTLCNLLVQNCLRASQLTVCGNAKIAGDLTVCGSICANLPINGGITGLTGATGATGATGSGGIGEIAFTEEDFNNAINILNIPLIGGSTFLNVYGLVPGAGTSLGVYAWALLPAFLNIADPLVSFPAAVQFPVPLDIDITQPVEIDVHILINGILSPVPGTIGLLGNMADIRVRVDTAANLEEIGILGTATFPEATETTGDFTVVEPANPGTIILGGNVRHQVFTLTFDPGIFNPRDWANIVIDRTDAGGIGVEYPQFLYLSTVAFRYTKV